VIHSNGGKVYIQNACEKFLLNPLETPETYSRIGALLKRASEAGL
jgi:hypothetical protein